MGSCTALGSVCAFLCISRRICSALHPAYFAHALRFGKYCRVFQLDSIIGLFCWVVMNLRQATFTPCSYLLVSPLRHLHSFLLRGAPYTRKIRPASLPCKLTSALVAWYLMPQCNYLSEVDLSKLISFQNREGMAVPSNREPILFGTPLDRATLLQLDRAMKYFACLGYRT